jgi:hypothetical protein
VVTVRSFNGKLKLGWLLSESPPLLASVSGSLVQIVCLGASSTPAGPGVGAVHREPRAFLFVAPVFESRGLQARHVARWQWGHHPA